MPTAGVEARPGLARVESNIIYGMHSGLALLMDAWRPEKPNGLGILFVGGSGWSSGAGYDAVGLKDREQQREGWVPSFLSAGYTVFCANHRAAPRFPCPAALQDIQRAIRFLRNRAEAFGIDPARIGGLGGSSGGHLLCLAALLAEPGDPGAADPVEREAATLQCLVLRAPPLDLVAMGAEADAEGSGYVADFIPASADGTGAGGTDAARIAASPLLLLEAGRGRESMPPTLLIHGDLDGTVPFNQSVMMRRAIAGAGLASELLAIPGGGHGPDFLIAEREKAVPGSAAGTPDYLGRAVEWMDRHLGTRPALI